MAAFQLQYLEPSSPWVALGLLDICKTRIDGLDRQAVRSHYQRRRLGYERYLGRLDCQFASVFLLLFLRCVAIYSCNYTGFRLSSLCSNTASAQQHSL